MKRWVRLVLVGAMTGLEVKAGYRNVSGAPPLASASARAMWTAVVVRQGREEIHPVNRAGRWDPIEVEALEEVEVVLSRPDVREGEEIFAYVVNGGRVNGEVATRLRVEEAGAVRLRFQAGRFSGDYPVVIRFAGEETVLTFWVRQAALAEDHAEEAP